MAQSKISAQEVRDFSNNRFMCSLTIHDGNSENIICQRYFETYKYIEGSMQTIEFKRTIDSIVNLIQQELEQETRIYLTYNTYNSAPLSFGHSFADVKHEVVKNDKDEVVGWSVTSTPLPQELVENGGFYDTHGVCDETLNEPLAEPYSIYLKFSVYDRDKCDTNKCVIEKIFDATCYPKEIRDNIVLTQNGKEVETDRLNGLAYIKAVIAKSREELIYSILSMIYNTCSPNTKDVSENEKKRIFGMLKETWNGKSTGAKVIYYNEKEKRFVKSKNSAND